MARSSLKNLFGMFDEGQNIVLRGGDVAVAAGCLFCCSLTDNE